MITNRLHFPLRAILASALGLVSLGAGIAAAGPAAAANRIGDEPDTVSISLAPSSATLAPDGTMTFVVSVKNNTTDDLGEGTATILTDADAIDSRADLSAWLAGEGDAAEHGTLTVPIPSLGAGGSFTSTPVAASRELLALGADFGAYPVELAYSSGDVKADARTTVVVAPPEGVPAQGVAVAMPLTVPANATGLINADALEVYTGPAGTLTKQLSAVIDRPVAIGIDPMIIASIRALGNAAPPSAAAWLERLGRATNEIFPLQYGDADPTVQTQAGAETLLAPTSLAWGLDPADFTPTAEDDGTVDASPTSTPGPTEAPTPTPPPVDDPVPTLDELLDWDYTQTGMAWPGADTVIAADLPVLAASGATTTIVSSDNVTFSGSGGSGRAAWAAADAAALLVADAGASEALSRAATTTDPLDHSIALSDLAAQLAVARSESASPLLLTFDRGWKATENRLIETVNALESMPGLAPASLAGLTAGPSTTVTIADKPQDAGRTSTVSQLLQRESSVDGFATVADDPTLIVGRERSDLMSLLGVSWQKQLSEWSAAVAAHNEDTLSLLDAVGITSTTPINMVANQTNIPVSVRNDLNQPVTVVLQASPSNPRLDIDAPSAQVIPAQSRETVLIPVAARLGNGDVTLRLQLYSTQHELIGPTVLVPVDVRADWETIGLIALVVIVVGLFVGGLTRTILKRRAQRQPADITDGADAEDADADGAADASPDTEKRDE